MRKSAIVQDPTIVPSAHGETMRTLIPQIEKVMRDIDTIAGELESIRIQILLDQKNPVWADHLIKKTEGMAWAAGKLRKDIETWEKSSLSASLFSPQSSKLEELRPRSITTNDTMTGRL